ncbi:hypothetical protein NPIL_289271 [Nephila pilipes]|uniref:Uncharacterized protein n=1 Tax=Nephila pilipes TaxID=299642 RepID=A0A8X6UJB9_NEPPI|nr:hypothetical protein NPIL_289271 [Nephila pilipes]
MQNGRNTQDAQSNNRRSNTPLRKSLSSYCSDTPRESSSGEEMSIFDPPIASSSGFQSVENDDSNSDEGLEDQRVPRVCVAYSVKNKLKHSAITLEELPNTSSKI